MSAKRKTLARGQILAAVVNASRLSKEEVARRAGYTRSAYYKHVEKPDLDYHIIIAYGRAIHHDFTEEFPDMAGYSLQEPDETYGEPRSLEDASWQINMWRNKYYDLLEKYHKLVEERIHKT